MSVTNTIQANLLNSLKGANSTGSPSTAGLAALGNPATSAATATGTGAGGSATNTAQAQDQQQLQYQAIQDPDSLLSYKATNVTPQTPPVGFAAFRGRYPPQ